MRWALAGEESMVIGLLSMVILVGLVLTMLTKRTATLEDYLTILVVIDVLLIGLFLIR
jgi:hypothetical protein